MWKYEGEVLLPRIFSAEVFSGQWWWWWETTTTIAIGGRKVLCGGLRKNECGRVKED